MAEAQKPEPDDPERPPESPQRWNSSPHVFALEDTPRVFEDLLGDTTMPFFHVFKGSSLKWFDVVDDERSPEAVTVVAARRNGDAVFADCWCAFPKTKTSAARFAYQTPGTVKALAYDIDTHLDMFDNSMQGRAECSC